MKTKIAFFVLGFFNCLGLLILGLFLTYKYYQNEKVVLVPEFEMNSSAYEDGMECPNYPYSTLVGSWSGEKEFAETGETRKWTNTRYQNGKYHIEFITYLDGSIIDRSTEEGLWSYSSCLYSVIVNKVNSSPALYQEVYRIHEVTNSIMRYSNFRTGNEFTMIKNK